MNILLTGRPGTGKTWVMKQLIEHYGTTTEGKSGLINYLHNDKVVITGKYVGDIFDGSDKLSMAAISSVPDLLDDTPDMVRIYDGDRFTNTTFLNYDPIIINILGDGSAGRRMRGSSQTEARLRAMATRYNSYSYHYRVEDSNEALQLVKDLIEGDLHNDLPELKDGRGQESLF